ncbi:MAG: diguanylate cyclase [Deltaproteobacteria bacterium]|nr:diguanylate cyclase [Deltaproteobacteria bacterium]NIS78082.1 diguanylate cyclase [Deltaproteobacteria bacterium]
MKRNVLSSLREYPERDERVLILYSVIAYLLILATNAAIDRLIFFQKSFWVSFLSQVSEFNNSYQLITLAFCLLYGVIASKIVARKRRWGEDLLKSKRKMKALLDAIPDTMFRLKKDGTLLESVKENQNDSLSKPFSEFLGKKIDAFLPPGVHAEVVEYVNLAITTGEMQIFEYQQVIGEDTYHHEARITSTGADEALVILRDITVRKNLEEELRALLITDDLTGLNNRRGFFLLANQQMKLADRTKSEMLLFYSDFDDLKWINDTFGHQEGDRAITEVSEILRKSFRKSDIISRLRGDEFAVLLINVTGSDVESIIERRFRAGIDELNGRPDRKYTVSLSIGTARYNPKTPCTIDDLLGRADELMYREKRSKKKRGIRTAPRNI